ncbi:MAG: SHOCT domain-containing protein [Oscillospiraceae bacterium]|nr:SHOCT domain-containing protein [Oscillospiraceae bacterium]
MKILINFIKSAVVITHEIYRKVQSVLILKMKLYVLKQNISVIVSFVLKKINNERKKNMGNVVYSFDGNGGKHLDVYEDKAVIKTKAGLGSLLTGGFNNGEKTIYYRDVIGVQFKKQTALQIGYLQLETASYQTGDNFFGENSFPFEKRTVTNEKMEEVANYVREKVDEARKNSGTTVNAALSPADELKKFKELLDSGIISQEEFDQKKKQLLGV